MADGAVGTDVLSKPKIVSQNSLGSIIIAIGVQIYCQY